jgi:predicted O-methyltransferase YrrM
VISKKIWTSAQYIKYRLRSVSKYKVHSPFAYKIYTEVILSKAEGSQPQIEKQRAWLLRQKSLMETTDFGAGAGKGYYKTRFRQTRNITKHSSVSPKYGRLWYRLVAFVKPETILEIGTAMGISTMYMAKAAPESRIVSMEGCAVIAASAKDNFTKLKINNIELAMGNFNQLLGKTVDKIERIDFVLIDGNHRKEPTLKYFEQILDKLHPGSVVVIDDIHWSKGMLEAWNTIKANEKVSVSIDLFRAGILFFREDIAKENHILRF